MQNTGDDHRDLNQLLILLSDVQIGRFGFIPADDDTAADKFSLRISDEIIKVKKERSVEDQNQVLFITGDLASTGSKKEYDTLMRCVILISCLSRIPRSNIYICPGNHDYIRDMSGSDSIESLRDKRFIDYLEFASNLYSSDLNKYLSAHELLNTNDDKQFLNIFLKQPKAPRVKINAFTKPQEINYLDQRSDLELDILSVNTTSKYFGKDNDNYGFFPEHQIRSLLHNHGESFRANQLKIAIGHHNLEAIGEVDTTQIRNSRSLKQFLKNNGYRFYLHGHQHLLESQTFVSGDDERQVLFVGIGATGAKKSELPEGRNGFSMIHRRKHLGELITYTRSNITESWSRDLKTNRFSLSQKVPLILEGKKVVEELTKEAFSFASKSIVQSFFQSAVPSVSSDAFDQNLVRRNVKIERFINTDSFEAVQFAINCMDRNKQMENSEGKTLQSIYISSDKAVRSHPVSNFLLVDDDLVIEYLSLKEKWHSTAIIHTSKVLNTVLSERLNKQKNVSEIADYEKLLKMKAKFVKSRPAGIVETIITEFNNLLSDELLFFGIVGSSIRKNTPQNTLNDVDIVMIVDKMTVSKHTLIKQKIDKTVASMRDLPIDLQVEYKDAPVRPFPSKHYTNPVYQLHILLYEPDQLSKAPGFISRARLASYRAGDGQHLEDYVKNSEDAIKDIFSHKTWSIDRLKFYCQSDQIPVRHWSNVDGRNMKYSGYLDPLKENWQKLEFYGYVIIKLSVNFISITNQDKEIYRESDTVVMNRIYDTLHDKKLINKLKRYLGLRNTLRKDGFVKISNKDILDFKSVTIEFLDIFSDKALWDEVEQ